MTVQEQGHAAEIGVDDMVLLAGDKPQLLARDFALLQRRQVRMRPQLLFDRFELLTDLGYLWDNPQKHQAARTVAHNTVVLDETDQRSNERGGEVKFFVSSPHVKAMRAASKAYAEEAASALRSAPLSGAGPAGGHEGTTHVSVMDEQGNAAAITHTVCDSSGVVTPGLGFMFNNDMQSFDPVPGHPNSIAPGKSPRFSAGLTRRKAQKLPHSKPES